MSKTIASVVTKMVSDLVGLKNDEERERAFAGARGVLGMAGAAPPASSGKSPGDAAAVMPDGGKIAGISTAGTTWINRHGLIRSQVEEYFHVEDGKVTLIGDAIGKGKREQSINTYLLTGVAAFLGTGKAEFTDKVARDYCERLGCYDSANHSKTLDGFGNRITGTKKAGWKLTSPGLSAAAALLKPKSQDTK